RGILSLSWCRKDPGLLLSSGKDNRTVCWNPATGEIVGELPPSNNWVYDVQWNQANPNLLSGASFDGRVSLYSLAREGAVEEAVATDDPFAPQSTSAFAPSLSLKRPPKWLARPCGAAFGFGGQLVHFGQQQQGALVSITEFVSEPELAQQARQLEELLQDDRAAELCSERLEQSRGSDQERSWQVLQILFESDARDKLVRFLGFDKEEVKGRIAELIKAKRAATEAEEAVEAAAAASEQAASEAEVEAQSEGRSEEQDSAAENPFASSTSLDADADDFFSKPIDVSAIDSTAATVGSAEPSVIESSADASVRALRLAFSGAFRIYDKRKDIALEDADGLITRAVLLGDIEAAVELCIEQEQFADALILATCGSAELAQRVQQAYFARRAQQASYVRLLHGIVLGDLGDVVGNGDLAEWDQIMALLCTYAQGDRFSTLCEQLGARLEQAGQLADAVLCYLASGNLDKVARIWIAREQALVGLQRVRALHAVVEKVSVFRKAVQFVDPAVSSEDSPVFELGALYDAYAEYAAFLASQGMFDIAARYLERTPAAYRCYLPTGEDALAALRNRLAISPDVPWAPAPVGADYEAQEKAAALAQGQAQAQALVQQQAQMQAQAQIPQQQQPQMQARPQIPQQQQQHQFAAASNVYGSAPTYGMPGAQHYASGPAYGMTQYAAANTFPPPPQPLNPASIPTGNTPPPRREEAAWNDPPMVAKPAKRSLPPAAAAITTPFPQGRGTPPPAAMTPFGGPPPPTAQQQQQQQMPPRGGFVPTANKPLPAAPAAQMMQPQQQPGFMPSTQQQQQPGFMPLPTQQMQQQPVSTQPTRGQVVSATPARGATPVNAKSPVPQQQQQQQQTTKYPAGDRSHMPTEWVKIVGSLGAHLARAKQFAAPAQKRMVEDADRRLSLLFDLMNCAEVKPQLVAGFEQLCAALDARQFPQALQCQAELMALGSEITSNLVGVKHLINVLKTLPM
ncbi:protein transport protein S31, partial [Kickxella alabastrina]